MIDNSNFVQYAIHAYDNPQCITLEQFNKDVKKFSYLKKILNSNQCDDEFVRLTLNNIVYLYNVFDYEACTKMMFFKTRKDQWYKLKTYLTFLNRMPTEIVELGIRDSDLPICQKIAKELRMI